MQEEREKMTVELQSKLEEERAYMRLQVDKTIKAQMTKWMVATQKVLFKLCFCFVI